MRTGAKAVGFFDHWVVQTRALHTSLANVYGVIHAGLANRSGKPGCAAARSPFSDLTSAHAVIYAVETTAIVVVVTRNAAQRRQQRSV